MSDSGGTSERVGFIARMRERVEWWRPRLGVFRRGLRVVSDSNITRMAAALAYRTVFGLIPMLGIAVAVLGAFATDEKINDAVTTVMELTGLNEIEIATPEDASPDTDPSPDQANVVPGPSEDDPEGSDRAPGDSASVSDRQDEPVGDPDGTPDGAPDGSSEGVSGGPGTTDDARRQSTLELWVLERIQDLRATNFLAIGIGGLVMLAYAAISFMVEIERSANQIYRAPTGRSWVRRVTQYWTTLTLGAVFLIGTFNVGDQLTSWGNSFAANAAGKGVNVLINFVLLFFVYMTVPNARVAIRPAAGGAIVAAIFWEIGKWGFKVVVVNSSAESIYGALALVPLFLLWVYISWIIVLSGLQISYMLQHFRPEDNDKGLEGPVLVDPLILVRVATEVAKGFALGETRTVADITKALDLDERPVLKLLQRLAQSGIVHEVPEGQERDAFSLARPADRVPVRELLDLAARSSMGAREVLEDDRLATLRNAQLKAAEGVTLADLARTGDDSAGRDDPAKTLGEVREPEPRT